MQRRQWWVKTSRSSGLVKRYIIQQLESSRAYAGQGRQVSAPGRGKQFMARQHHVNRKNLGTAFAERLKDFWHPFVYKLFEAYVPNPLNLIAFRIF